jgi:hypothetical protein
MFPHIGAIVLLVQLEPRFGQKGQGQGARIFRQSFLPAMNKVPDDSDNELVDFFSCFFVLPSHLLEDGVRF